MRDDWCPNCEESRHGFRDLDDERRCTKCETSLTTPPLSVRLWHRTGQAIAGVILGVFVLGPPAWTLYNVVTRWGEEPLLAMTTKTVTVREPTGLLVDSGFALLPWSILVFLILMAPYAPRRFR